MSISMNVADDNKAATIKINGRFDFSLHNDFRKSYKDVTLSAGICQQLNIWIVRHWVCFYC